MREIFLSFLKLGFIAFGGPAAHIGMYENEFVHKKKWLTHDKFLDLLGFTNLVPGPNSTELAISIGFLRGGYLGLVLAGVGFILPAMLIVLVLAYIYMRYGQLHWMETIFSSIMPVILTIITLALIRFSKTLLKDRLSVLLAVLAMIASLFGITELPILLGGALLYKLLRAVPSRTNSLEPISLSLLFLSFLKIGGFLYGTGYVLLSFLRTSFVETGLLTSKQLVDAVAVGQFTPGPLFTTATFIGYMLQGLPGALIATQGIFLPSFVFVLIFLPLMERLQRSQLISTLLKGVNAASLGLMAAVTLFLGRSHLDDPYAIVLYLASLLILLRTRLNPTWLIIAAAVIGTVRVLV